MSGSEKIRVQQGINWIGLRTLFTKEVRRFSKVWGQTIFAPLVTNSLYFLVFGVALGSRLKQVGGVSYIEFVIPGLIALAMIRNGFANASSSIFQSKINGTITDLLIAPLGTFEMMSAYIAASVLRACVVGMMILLVGYTFSGLGIAHLGWMLFFWIALPALFASLGIVIALWAEKFDHLNVVPSFVLTPLIYLGGVFYTTDMLPAPWDAISRYDPMLYMVNGMRYALLGVSEVPVTTSAAVVIGGLVLTTSAALVALSKGYNLRS